MVAIEMLDQRCNSTVHLFWNYYFTLSSISAITQPSYIVGLAYYELGGQTVNVVMPATIPNNTALVITLYEAYHPGFRQQYDANVNIIGSGRNHVKTIIWATYKSALHFFSNSVNKRVSYAGYKRDAVNKVAQNEFGKDADVVYSSYASPVNINVFYSSKYYFTRTVVVPFFNMLAFHSRNKLKFMNGNVRPSCLTSWESFRK